ncbi:unnamed protein product, partial [Linum tenue]
IAHPVAAGRRDGVLVAFAFRVAQARPGFAPHVVASDHGGVGSRGGVADHHKDKEGGNCHDIHHHHPKLGGRVHCGSIFKTKGWGNEFGVCFTSGEEKETGIIVGSNKNDGRLPANTKANVAT